MQSGSLLVVSAADAGHRLSALSVRAPKRRHRPPRSSGHLSPFAISRPSLPARRTAARPWWAGRILRPRGMEEAGGGEVAYRPLVGIDLREPGRCAALDQFPKQLGLRVGVGMEFEDEPENRPLQRIVFFVIEPEPTAVGVRRSRGSQ